MSRKCARLSLERFADAFGDASKIASLADGGRGAWGVVAHCGREARRWRELRMVEAACARLKSPVLRKTVRAVYRVVRLEPCAETEQRPLILRILRVNEGAYYKRIERIVKILR